MARRYLRAEPGVDIVGRIFDPYGNAIVGQGQFQFNTAGAGAGEEARPKIAALPDGGFVVAYRSFNAGFTASDGITVERYNSNGGAVASRFIAAPQDVFSATIFDITVNAAGDYIVAFEKMVGSTVDVHAFVFNGGTNDPGLEHVNTAQNNNGERDHDSLGDIDTFFNGDIVCISHETDQVSGIPLATSWDTVEIRITSSTGSNVRNPIHIAGSNENGASADDVVVLEGAGDRFVALYHYHETDGTNVTALKIGAVVPITAQTPTDVTLGPEIVVAPANTFNTQVPSLVALQDGGFFVAWIRDGIVFGTRYSSNGTVIGEQGFTVATLASNSFNALGQLSLTVDGRILVPFLDIGGEIAQVILDPREPTPMIGAEDADVLVAQTTASSLFGLGGSDRLYGYFGDDFIQGGDGNDLLEGSAGDDTMDGQAHDDLLRGGAGDDTLNGGAGADDLFGGANDDLYILNSAEFRDVGDGLILFTYDFVTENANEGADTVVVRRVGSGINTLTSYTLGANVENGIIDGTGGFNLTGNALANVLTGNAAANRFTGGGGFDIIDGGAGADTAVFAAARGNYQVHTNRIDGVTSTFVFDGAGTEGFDRLTAVETLAFSSGNVTLFTAQQNLTSNVDAQRFDDVVYRSVSNGQVIFQNMTNGVAVGFDAVTAPLTADWKAIGTGDLTGNNRADVLIWNGSTGQVFSASPGGSGVPTYAVIANGITGSFAAVGSGDIDGDGFTDLVVRDGSNGAISWLAMTAASPDAFAPVGTFGPGWAYQGTGDVNRDGFADVIIRSSGGQVVVVNMANGVQAGFIDLGNIPGFRIGAVADLNADGFDDIALQNEADGQVIWRNLSDASSAWSIATDPMGTSWLLRRAADVDNDGSADLILQHATTGETIYRAMDNGVGAGWGTVSNAVGTDWVVV